MKAEKKKKRNHLFVSSLSKFLLTSKTPFPLRHPEWNGK